MAGDLPWMRALEGTCLAKLDRIPEARAILDELEHRRATEYCDAMYMAVLRNALGERAHALQELERAFDESSPFLHSIDVDPKMQPFRNDPTLHTSAHGPAGPLVARVARVAGHTALCHLFAPRARRNRRDNYRSACRRVAPEERAVKKLVLALWLASSVLTPTADGATGDPLVAAAAAGDMATVRRLLRQGHDVNAAGPDGATALHWAVRAEDDEAVAMLVAAGAKVVGGERPRHHTRLRGGGAGQRRDRAAAPRRRRLGRRRPTRPATRC